MLEDMLEKLGAIRESANVERVFGKPIEAAGKTIIPVAELRMMGGFGFGHGGGKDTAALDRKDSAAEGGGGGRIEALPVAVIEVTGEATNVIRIDNTRTQALKLWACIAGGILMGMAVSRCCRKRASE